MKYLSSLIFFTAIFSVCGVYLFSKGLPGISYVLFFLAAVFLLITLINADALRPLNRLWMYFGLLLGIVISPIVLGVIFFGIFTPISLLMRLFGRDELRLKLTAQATQWKERDSNEMKDSTFKYQF